MAGPSPGDGVAPPPAIDPGNVQRLLFLGNDGLADGFRLIGFETHVNPRPEEVERLLRDLVRDRDHALVIVEDALMHADIPTLHQVRREGGRIVVVAVPPLSGPPRLASDVAARLAAMFGGGGDP